MKERTGEHAIRVVIVDDHPMLREGTRVCLEREEGIVVVGVAEDGAGALQLVAQHQPDVLILDVHLPDISGVEVTRRVRAEFPAVAILIITGYDEVGYLRALLKLGVQGYIPKTTADREIVVAVRAVASGQQFIVGVSESAAQATETVDLTPREFEVLDLIVAGQRNTEIAMALGISLKTAEFHVGQVLRKLKARSRAEAIIKGQQYRLVNAISPGSS